MTLPRPAVRLRLDGWRAYAFAATTVMLAGALRWLLPEELGTRAPYPTFLLAVFVSTWVGGWRAGLFASALTIVAAVFVFPVSPPPWSWHDVVALAVVFAVGIVGTVITDQLRRRLDVVEHEREWHRRVVDRVGDAVLVVDGDGALRWFNRRASQLWRLGADHLGKDAALSAPLWFEGDGGRWTGLRQAIDAVAENADLPAGLEVRDGAVRLAVVGNVSRFVDPERGPGAVVALQAVQDLRDASRRAEAMEGELRLILETTPARIAYLDLDGRYRWTNRAFADWFDIAGDVHGTPLVSLLDDATRETLEPAFARARDGSPATIEWRYEHPRLGRRWTTTTVTPDLGPQGEVRGLISLCMDSTERHLTEEALRRSDAEHRSLADNVPHMVWMAGSDGALQYVNSRWLEFTGSTPSGHWFDAVHAEDRERARAGFAQAGAAGTPFAMELRFRRAGDDALRWHMVRARPFHDAQGELWRWYGTCTDVQDQKAAQDTLREAHGRTTHFLATLSHELRNPLAALSASAALLEHAAAGPEARSDATSTIGRQTRHLQRLVDDLLDISRITLDKIRIAPTQVDLRDLCRDVCRDFSARAQARGIRLDCHVPDAPVPVHGDPARLRQCVDNLVSNALKASTGGMTVTVRVERDGGDVRLVVTDEGIGLPPEDLPRVFETFVQGAGWRHRGLGLGLSIVQRLVELHGGRVHAESDGPDRGARFVITLPATADAAPRDDEATPSRPTVSGSVLVVDDEIDNARTLQILLQLEGFTVHTAADGHAAIAVATEMRPDVVVCDLGLPEPLDGFDVAQRLRVMFGANVHLCAYSGYGSRADIDRALAAGFDAHITKPGSPAKIVDEIRAGLGRLKALRS